ncbi:hypothetical protein SAMN05192560_0752 [Methylobacillus rhizosphaerae]|uniref:Uncharacterized protein n=1 Tax=Methylobacillus rhizosphaerae TaxID=551994 RepID=A0A238YPT1_9PROT|nr:hypothetical protein [Methylobacillus rhizosphaerae]SNR73276.1 hypothetical protein SAMN05192560_0752 [Methylobacillus rhizosphaerae]
MNSRLDYHTLDVEAEILKDPRMVARAMELFDHSDAFHFDSLISNLMSVRGDNLVIAREAIAEFLRSKLKSYISDMVQKRVDAEMEGE